MNANVDVLSTEWEYNHLMNLATAAVADGMPSLAAEYAVMAGVYERQLEAEKRIDAAAEKDIRSQARIQDNKDARYEIETTGSRSCTRWGKAARHEAAMRTSNLYLAIRNAVYFE
jgi:hypothetical protein